jgi:hypothetical protein
MVAQHRTTSSPDRPASKDAVFAGVQLDIAEWSLWPEEFLTYERVLKLGRKTGRIWMFYDSASPALVATVGDLLRERPDISVDEIAYLLSISVAHASSLLG